MVYQFWLAGYDTANDLSSISLGCRRWSGEHCQVFEERSGKYGAQPWTFLVWLKSVINYDVRGCWRCFGRRSVMSGKLIQGKERIAETQRSISKLLVYTAREQESAYLNIQYLSTIRRLPAFVSVCSLPKPISISVGLMSEELKSVTCKEVDQRNLTSKKRLRVSA